MEILTYDKQKKRCDREPPRHALDVEKGIFVKGLKTNTLWALMENTTFQCTECAREVDIIEYSGDVVMLVRHRLCPLCYNAKNEDL